MEEKKPTGQKELQVRSGSYQTWFLPVIVAYRVKKYLHIHACYWLYINIFNYFEIYFILQCERKENKPTQTFIGNILFGSDSKTSDLTQGGPR